MFNFVFVVPKDQQMVDLTAKYKFRFFGETHFGRPKGNARFTTPSEGCDSSVTAVKLLQRRVAEK